MKFGKKSQVAKITKKLNKRSANSQMHASHPDARNFGRKAKPWERMRYFDKCRKPARGQRRISLAMNATDISKKNYMNATACLPQKKWSCGCLQWTWVGPGAPGPWSTESCSIRVLQSLIFRTLTAFKVPFFIL